MNKAYWYITTFVRHHSRSTLHVPERVRVGLFNARSVSNKTAAVQRWISDSRLNLAALVEAWNDDAAIVVT